MKPRPRKRPLARQRTGNMILRGVGAETLQDRGAQSTASQHTLHPYYNNNFISRWQEYTRWYMTSWEARKIIDIPVQDALRVPVELRELHDSDTSLLMEAYEEFECERQLRRALTQERLLGGSVLLPIFLRQENEETASKLRYSTLQKGDLQAINVVDVSKLARPSNDTDPFSAGYDRVESLLITGVEVHSSRMLVLDGDALFNRASQMVLENYRFNPCGFGESRLAPLYDLLIRVVGTQQGAYHLVNLSSCLILSAAQLRSMTAVGSPAKAKLEEIAEQLSIFRAAIVDAKDVEFKQHSATFGSVPELVMSFLQILSAGSDIPATRFLGQAPGGLNATGDSDLENYYNNVASWQRSRLLPAQTRLFDWLGAHIWGWEVWKVKSKDLELHYPPLWNLDDVQQSTVDNTYAMLYKSLYEIGVIDAPAVIAELKKREIFQTEVEASDFLEQPTVAPENPFDPNGQAQ